MAMHGATHHHIVTACLVEKDVFFERTEDDEETPVAKPRMGETRARPKLGVLAEKFASAFTAAR